MIQDRYVHSNYSEIGLKQCSRVYIQRSVTDRAFGFLARARSFGSLHYALLCA